jgi:hypothetical protein
MPEIISSTDDDDDRCLAWFSVFEWDRIFFFLYSSSSSFLCHLFYIFSLTLESLMLGFC